MDSPLPQSPSPIDDDATGLPVLHTWPAVYLFVLVVFIFWVVVLAALPMMFS